MKRIIIAVILMITIPFVLKNSAVAAAVPLVYGEDLTLSKGEEKKIAIRIKGNTGIMGIKIHGTYDASVIKIESTAQGKLTEKGIFAHNEDNASGNFDIVWAGMEDIKDDGVLFYIMAKAEREFDLANIALDYSKEDTFDESYKDVAVKCQKIVIKFDKKDMDNFKDNSQKKNKNAYESNKNKKKKNRKTNESPDKRENKKTKNNLDKKVDETDRKNTGNQKQDKQSVSGQSRRSAPENGEKDREQNGQSGWLGIIVLAGISVVVASVLIYKKKAR